jgi:hypothetical protein
VQSLSATSAAGVLLGLSGVVILLLAFACLASKLARAYPPRSVCPGDRMPRWLWSRITGVICVGHLGDPTRADRLQHVAELTCVAALQRNSQLR